VLDGAAGAQSADGGWTDIERPDAEDEEIAVTAELACSARPRRYAFHYDEVAEAEAQGLPYLLVPRELSREEWEKKYCTAGAGEREKK
jgi:hypothetical protein